MEIRALIKNKKGIFFTFMAILVIIFFFLYFSIKNESTFADKVPAQRTRVIIINDFLQTMEDIYFKRAMAISAKRSFDSLTEFMVDNGNFRDDVSHDIESLMTNATILNTSVSSSGTRTIALEEISSMDDYTLYEIMFEYINFAEKVYGVNITLSVDNITLEQNNMTGPWNVLVFAHLEYNLSSDVVNWHRNTTISEQVSILGLRDPYIELSSKLDDKNSDGTESPIEDIQRIITIYNKTNKTENFNLDEIKILIESGSYFARENISAPSFLDRFQENGYKENSTCCGIFSMINPRTDLRFTDPTQYESKSYVDYMFYDNFCPTSSQLWEVEGLYSTDPGIRYYDFKIDSYILDKVFGYIGARNESNKVCYSALSGP